MKSALVLIVILPLAACTTTETSDPASWHKSGISSAQITIDLKVCEYEAEKAGLGSGSRSNPLGAGLDELINKKKLQRLCMESRGYAKS